MAEKKKKIQDNTERRYSSAMTERNLREEDTG